MTTLRVLLVENDPAESERIAGRLTSANHAVLPTGGLEEAAQAMELQRFDAVLVTTRLVTDELQILNKYLQSIQTGSKDRSRVPVFCYARSSLSPPTTSELARLKVDACLPEGFDAIVFSQLVANLASGISGAHPQAEAENSELAVFEPKEFEEQMGFDRDLIIEIVDLFLTDSQHQVDAMREALRSGNLRTLSQIAHSLKGSLGSIYALRAASTAHLLEQTAKGIDREKAAELVGSLESDLETLKPELLRLRNATSGS